jgi:hypothetical protein
VPGGGATFVGTSGPHADFRRTAALLLSGCIALSAACGKLLRPDRPAPKPPGPIPPLEDSIVYVPVAISLDQIQKALEKAVPAGRDHWGAYLREERFCVKYKIWRDALELSMSGDTLQVQAGVHFQLGLAKRAGKACVAQVACGASQRDPPRRATAGYSGRVKLEEDWHLSTRAHSDGVEIIDTCRLTIAGYDAGAKIVSVVEELMTDLAPRIDKLVASVKEVRNIAEDVWEELQKPIELGDDLWLLLDPQRVLASPLRSGGRAANVTLGVVVRPVVIIGQKPAAELAPLPALGSLVAGSGFHVPFEARITFAEATRQAQRLLVPKHFTLGGGRTETIREIDIAPNGDYVVVRLRIEGAAEGTLYLRGRPAYDATAGVLSLEHLDYTVETEKVLLNAADWLLHENFRETLQDSLTWPLGEELESRREKIAKALNRKVGKATMSGTFTSLRTAAIYLTESEIVARAMADGTLRVTVP